MQNRPERAGAHPDLHLEYADEVSEDALKTIIAFANTDGGRLLIGMRKDGARVPVADPPGALRELKRLIREEVEPDLSSFVKLEMPDDGAAPILAEVEPAPHRPYALVREGAAPRGVWIRRYGRTAEAKPSIIDAMKRDEGPLWDARAFLNPSPHFSMLNRLGLEKGILGAETLRDSKSFLTRDGAWSRTAEVFSDENGFFLRCVRFGDDALQPLEDERFPGGLLTELFAALAWLEERGAGRFGLNILQESLVNALLHRDYALEDAEILVKLYSERLEIVSPGGLPQGMTPEDAAGGLSRVRNPGILEALRSVGLARGLGGGVGRMKEALLKRGGRFELRVLPGCVILVLEAGKSSAAASLPERRFPLSADHAALDARQSARLSKVETLAIEFLRAHPGAPRREVQEAVGLSQAGAVNLLRRLIERGLAAADGNGPSTRYRSLS